MVNYYDKSWRNDAFSKVTGRARYTSDLKFNNMLHAVPVYTDYVHAKINSINTQIAENCCGVVKVIIAKDIPGKAVYGHLVKDHNLLASEKIRYHGDVIAIVVAATREQAIEAAAKVTVDVTELPKILDVERAFADSSVLVHEDKGDNVIVHHKVRRGNIVNGFANAAHIVEQRFTTQFIEHAYIEPESAVCIPMDDGVIQVYGTLQHHFTARKYVAAILGAKLSDVDVIGVPLGGGFGGKDDTANIICARTALAAKITGRAVKMTYNREWSIRESYKRHPYIMNYKMGVTSQGKIVAVECHILADGGAYASMTPFVTWRSVVQCCGPYVVPNVQCDVYGVYTNKVFTGAMRGFGSPQINFAIEQLIDMAAEKVCISGIKMRKLNLVVQNSITITEQKLDNHIVSSHEVLKKVLDEIDYDTKVKNCSRGKSNTDELYGIGIANSYRGMSLGAEGKDFCSAIINVQFDGSVLLEVGYQENGQGLESTMVLLLASELGIDKEKIRYLRSSTSLIPDGGPCVASRGVLMASGALAIAVKKLKQLITTVMSHKLNCNAEKLRFENGYLCGKDDDQKISWEDAINEMFLERTYPYAFGLFRPPITYWQEDIGQGVAYFTWVYGCQAVELTVNKITGKVKILNIVAAHDVGRALNPSMLLGQYYGGICQGIGYALQEELKFQDGKIISDNFNTYKIPKASEVPDITGIIVENHDPNTMAKAKGIGEPALELIAPAIANAIYNATGKRYCQLPIRVK